MTAPTTPAPNAPGLIRHTALKVGMPLTLNEARVRLAMTQQALAEKSGVSRATIAKLESGRVIPQPMTVHRLARALGVDQKELRFGVTKAVATDRTNVGEGLHRIADALDELVSLLKDDW